MTITPIQVPGTPAPSGHYAQAIVHGGLVFVSGQLPVDLATGSHCQGGIEAQADQVLRNLEAVLLAAGSGLDQLLKVTVYLADVAHWAAFNAVYARMLGGHRPARAVVPCGALHHGFLVEIEAVAAVRP